MLRNLAVSVVKAGRNEEHGITCAENSVIKEISPPVGRLLRK